MFLFIDQRHDLYVKCFFVERCSADRTALLRQPVSKQAENYVAGLGDK
jgi:hypothetical protein